MAVSRNERGFSLLLEWEGTTGQDGQVFGFTTVRIVGPSMEPALRNGHTHLVRLDYPVHRFRIGDVALLQHPRRRGLLTVKRLVRVEPSGWWVEGDNQESSEDSRDFGPVPADLMRGKVLMRLSPVFR